MKMIASAVSVLIGSVLFGTAQGIILRPGDTLSFGFSRVDNCQQTMEAFPPDGLAYVFFRNDLLGPDESLRLEMFENNTSEPAIANQTYTSLMPLTFVGLSSSRAWRDFQGVIRVSMIAGSVEVTGGRFAVFPDPFTVCDTFVAVPEPSTFALLASTCVVGAFAFWRKSSGAISSRRRA